MWVLLLCGLCVLPWLLQLLWLVVKPDCAPLLCCGTYSSELALVRSW